MCNTRVSSPVWHVFEEHRGTCPAEVASFWALYYLLQGVSSSIRIGVGSKCRWTCQRWRRSESETGGWPSISILRSGFAMLQKAGVASVQSVSNVESGLHCGPGLSQVVLSRAIGL